MSWIEKLDIIERAHTLMNSGTLTYHEFNSIKAQILEKQDFLKSEEWVNKTGTGETQPSNLGAPLELNMATKGVIERDSILDGEVINAPVKKFKNDFERINIKDG